MIIHPNSPILTLDSQNWAHPLTDYYGNRLLLVDFAKAGGYEFDLFLDVRHGIEWR